MNNKEENIQSTIEKIQANILDKNKQSLELEEKVADQFIMVNKLQDTKTILEARIQEFQNFLDKE